MSRSYAGILGLLAFSTMLMRGAVAGESAEGTLMSATIFLFAFAATGAIVGGIAQSTVEEAVRTRFAAEMKAAEASSETASPGRKS